MARGAEDYYTNSGEAPGYWLGSGAADLKLQGGVSEDSLRAVLNGFHPNSGERLINGKPTKRERVPGFDLTFRVPKSVSLLHALGPKEASNEVASAHDQAVAAALKYLEREASAARRGKGGRNRIASEGVIAAAFRHRASRAGDPLLHTHALVANIIKGDDGRWGALDARQLYVQAKTAGYLYQAHLRHELTRRLGVQWSEVRNGTADIDGIPRRVIRAFSKRRAEIEEIIGAPDEASGKVAQVAALTTRKAKDYRVTPNELLVEWKERARSFGLDDNALEKVLDRTPYRAPTALLRASIETDLARSSGLTAQASSFTRKEAIQGFCNRLQLGAGIEDIEAMADSFLASEQVIPLSARAHGLTAGDSLRVSDGRIIPSGVEEQRYSTEDMLSVEQAVIKRAIERRLDGCGLATGEAVDSALAKRPSLFSDQQAMVRRLTTSGQGVEVVVGKAGAGKTFALDAARDAWETSGHRVVGCALSARAADELQLGAGIPSFTIAGLLADLDHDALGGLAPGSVLVVDEAGMVGSRDLNRLLDHATRADAKVVLVGDDRQLPEISSGGAFRGIKNRLPAVELSEVRRQPFGWERDALDLIRQGRSAEAIDAYLAHDRVVLETSSEETRRRLIGDWWATQDEAEPAMMLAARRSDVADLNRRARALMRAGGKLGDEEVEFGGQSFATGDRIMTLKNTRHLGVKNGTRGIIESVDGTRGEIAIRREDGVVVSLPRGYLEAGHITHGYAITGHKAQGMTTDKAYVLGDQTLYREWTYVAMSRGRNDNRLYVVGGIDPDREELGGEVAGIEDPLKELIAAVGRSRAKDLALDSYEHEEVRNLSTAELREQWEMARGIVEHMPGDLSGERTQLAAERKRLEQMLSRQESLATENARRLKEIGMLGKRRYKTEVRALEARIQDGADGALRLRTSLDDVVQQEAEIERADTAREAWLLENAPGIRRLDALGRELWWREQQQAIVAEVAMPTYLLDAVGERPMKPSERAAWHEAVRAIETYRHRWGVTDGQRALPQEIYPDDQRTERDGIERRVSALTEISNDSELEVIHPH